jgi:HD-GYP domain-containing protein (c-di-GMP phosphodiesterase class II)
VRSCHERWDGHGYPDGLKGSQIPRAARVVFSCDAYNAMTTDRPYRQAIGREAAVKELWANAGTQFDPTVVAALTAVVYREDMDPVLSPADALRQVLAAKPAPLVGAAGPLSRVG